MVTVPPSLGPVLTETQAKTLATLKAVAAAGRATVEGLSAKEAVDSAKIKLPGLLVAAGSAAATGDIRAAQRVARETRLLANSLHSGLDQGRSAKTPDGQPLPPAVSGEQAQNLYKQLKLALVRAQIALVQPYGQPTDPSVKRQAEADIRQTERALSDLEAKIRGGGSGSKPAAGGKRLDIQV
jgi:hypothetical protein